MLFSAHAATTSSGFLVGWIAGIVVAAPRTTGQLLWYPPHSINVAGRRRGRVV